MKNKHPSAGRLPKKPSKKTLEKLGALTPIANDIRKILNDSRKKHPGIYDNLIDIVKAPSKKLILVSRPIEMVVSDKTIELICEFFLTSCVIDATWKPETKAHRKILFPANLDRAIRFSKLFADAPNAMIDALPKIQKLISKFYWGTPRKAVISYYARKHDRERHTGTKDFTIRFFTDKSNALALELTRKIGISGITARTIEHARNDIRKLY